MFWGKIRNGLAQTKSKSGPTNPRRVAASGKGVRVCAHPPFASLYILRYQASVSSEILSRILLAAKKRSAWLGSSDKATPQARWKKGSR